MGRNETSNFRLLFMISGTYAFSLFALANIVSRPCYGCKLSTLALSEAGGDQAWLIANQRQTKSPHSSLSLKGYVTQRATKKIGVLFYIRKWRRTSRGRGLKVMRHLSKFLQLMLKTQLLIFRFSLSRRPLSIFKYIDPVFKRSKLVTCS